MIENNTDSLKCCKTCKKDLSLVNFNKDSRTKDKLCRHCKKCTSSNIRTYRELHPLTELQKQTKKYKWQEWLSKNRERKDRVTNKWREENPEKYQNSIIKRKYGIDKETYNELLVIQKESCAICKKHKSNFDYPLFIDHCHRTKVVRGLLCRNCNTGLGNFKDNIEFLEIAISYLKKYK